jgi:hypothetical protein
MDNNRNGMLSNMPQGPGLLKMREAYNRYAADMMARGQAALPPDVWMAQQQKAMETMATPPEQGVGGPSSDIVRGIEAREAAELARRRAEQQAIMDAARAAARAKQQGMLPRPVR